MNEDRVEPTVELAAATPIGATKPDELRRFEVDDRQSRFVELLICGESVTDAARAVGVSRQTASGWKNKHPGVRAELGSRRRELEERSKELVRSTDERSIEVIRAAIDEGDTKAAFSWLKLRNVELSRPAYEAETIEAVVRSDADALRYSNEHRPLIAAYLDDQTSLGLDEATAIVLAEIVEE